VVGGDIVLNVHDPIEDKIDDTKESFCEEVERVFDKFSKHHKKLLGMRVCTKAVIIMELEWKFCHIEKSGCQKNNVPHRLIHKFASISPDGKTIRLTIFR
jgi:hypothetical protein